MVVEETGLFFKDRRGTEVTKDYPLLSIEVRIMDLGTEWCLVSNKKEKDWLVSYLRQFNTTVMGLAETIMFCKFSLFKEISTVEP